MLIIILLKNTESFDNKYLDQNNIKRITREISINRPVGSPNLLKVKTFVMDELNKLGLDVEEQKFTRQIKGKDYKFSNIIAKNKNIDDNFIILGAHIDGPQIENVEATTDAVTCIAFIIEIVKNLLLINKNYPIMIVFFDGEEAIDGSWADDNTLSGSTYFVNNFNKNIEYLMIFDLIGGNIEKNKIIHFTTNNFNKENMIKLANINKKYNKQIFVDPNNKISSTFIINDFTPFINKYPNLKGLNLIPDVFPDNHHNINDNYNNVNWEYIDIFSNVIYEFLLGFKIP